jgi:D-amino peptidase
MSNGPRIFIMVDMEGISGICNSSQVSSAEGAYALARRYMTWDANACVAGCFEGGASKVVVRDAHAGGFNMIWDEFDPRGEYIQGRTARQRMPELETFDGLILLGYHAMAGTVEGVLEHTMSSKHWQNLRINGRLSGEVAIDAGIAGDAGVPTILVTGDDKVCAEAREFIPGIETAEVKKGLDCQGAQLLPKQVAHDILRKASERAVRRCREIKPFVVGKPVTMTLEVVSRGVVPVTRADVKVIDGRTYEVTAGTVEQALRML